jgi:plastocyanin
MPDRRVVGSVPRRVVGLVPGLALAALVSGCGHQAAAAGEQHVSIVVNDQLKFVPDRIVVHPGTVVLKIHDVGAIPHNIDIPSLHVVSPLVHSGGTIDVIVNASRPGSYPFVCDLHVMDGMTGTLVVRPAAASNASPASPAAGAAM